MDWLTIFEGIGKTLMIILGLNLLSLCLFFVAIFASAYRDHRRDKKLIEYTVIDTKKG